MPAKTSKIKLDGTFAKGSSAQRRSSLLPGGWWLWCLVGLGLGLGVWIGGRGYLRTKLSERLAAAPSGSDALASIDALMRLDADAAVDVSRALAHPDLIVAHAAFRALNEQVDGWGQLGTAQRASRMGRLLDQLENTPRDGDQDHRILVTGLASRLYAEALSSRDSAAGELLDRCQHLLHRGALPTDADTAWAPLESSQGDGDMGDSAARPLPPIERAGTATAAPLGDDSVATDQASRAVQPRLASSAMPRLSSMPSAEASGEAPDAEDTHRSGAAAPRFKLAGASSRQATLFERPAAIILGDADRDRPADEATGGESQEQKLYAAQPFDTSGAEPRAGSNLHASAQGSSAVEATLAGVDDLSIDQLVRLLSSPQPQVSQAAALALRGKGMSDDKLDLAMQLAVGTAAERTHLLTSMGSRSDLDPRPWLLWMAAEGEPAVREQAVGMLAPLLDQEVRRQLRLRLNQERDERVAQTIRRVLVH